MPITAEDRRLATLLGLPQLWPQQGVFLSALSLQRHGQPGVVVDLFHQYRITGYTATVWLVAAQHLPGGPAKLLVLPYEMYDCPEEIVAAGWARAT